MAKKAMRALLLLLNYLLPLVSIRMAPEVTSLKKHQNKYDRFSRAKEDPLVEAMSRARNLSLSQRLVYRGTTVPLEDAIPKTSRNSSRTFKDIRDIVPSDPSSFGYLQIGFVSGTHGVRGEVKVSIESDFAESYLRQGNTIYIKRPNRLTPRYGLFMIYGCFDLSSSDPSVFQRAVLRRETRTC